MLLSNYDLINYFRQLFKVWFTNWTFWNWNQEIELSSPPEASFQLAQNQSKSWLNLCCFSWLGLTSVFGFHKISKGHFWSGFLQLQSKLIRMKSKVWQQPWAWYIPLPFRLAEWVCTCENESVKAILPNDYIQPWNVEVYNIFYITSYLVCVVLNKYILWVSICSPGSLILGEDVCYDKELGKLSEPLKFRTWCQYSDFSPQPLYTTSKKNQLAMMFYLETQPIYITSFPYKLICDLA